MNDVQKFKSFSELKNAERSSETVTHPDEVKHFLELLRHYARPIESTIDKDAK